MAKKTAHDRDTKVARNSARTTSVARPAATSVANEHTRSETARAAVRGTGGRRVAGRDPEEEVPADEALRDLESLRPNVGKANPNPQPRPAMSSQGGGRLEDVVDDNTPAARDREARRAQGRIKVQATQMGYYDHIRRRPGDIFTISGDKLEADVMSSDGKTVLRKEGEVAAFSRKWMRRVATNTPERVTTGKEHLQKIHDETLGQNMKRASARSGNTADDDDAQNDVNQNPAARRGTGDVDLVD